MDRIADLGHSCRVRSLLVAPRRPATHPTLRVQSDQRLTDLAAGGFEPAFEVLVLRHRPALLRYCTRILGPDRAEDVVQKTFIRAYEVIVDGVRVDNLRPWLFRVAHNAALDSLKDRSLHHVELDEGLNGVERPDQAFERSERLRDVVAAVQKLPPRQRDAIVLRELEGRSYEEIAREMTLSGGAVRQLLARARTTLRAACSALTPYSVINRVPWGGSEPVTARVAEVVGGTGAPVVVAQVCAAAIVTCVAGGGAPEPKRAQPPEDRAAQAAPQVRPLASLPPVGSPVPAGGAPSAAPRLVPPDELPLRKGGEPVSASPDGDEEKAPPAKRPAAPEAKPPVEPTGPAYEYAYPVGIADPLACVQRRRARSACEDPADEPAPEPEPAAPVATAPVAAPPAAAPTPVDPPSATAPPAGTGTANPPAGSTPPTESPPAAAPVPPR